MVRKPRERGSKEAEIAEVAVDSAPTVLTKSEFGQRLYDLLLRRGLRQAEFARLCGLRRDAVWTYIHGRSLPSEINLRQMARVLNVTPDELLPNLSYVEPHEEPTDFSFTQHPTDKGKAWVRLNRLMSMSAALKIAAIAHEDASGK